MDGPYEFGMRTRNRTPAVAPFPLPPPLQRMLDLGKANLETPFKGLTADGTVAPGLYRIEKTGHALADLVAAARRYLAALTPAERTRTSFTVDSTAWQAWCNIHPFMMRHGQCLKDLGADAREAAFGLLRASLSAAGFQSARDVMRLNETVLELTGRPEEYGEWLYWISIMGEPSATEPWGWQIDGHHLIVNCFVLGDQMVLTPNFMGSEPVHARTGRYSGTRVFDAEERDGHLFMGTLSPEQRAQATIGDKLPFDVMATAFHDNDTMPYRGVRWAELARGQQEAMESLIGLYTGRIRPGHAEVRYAEVKRHLESTWFAWIGAFDETSPFYYRIHNPVILIEFDHQSGIVYDNDHHARNHIHTCVRTPNGNDYGKDLLRLHYARHDHSDPASPHRQGKA